MAKIDGPKPEAGQELFDVTEKVFPDLKAEPGEEACIFMHTVPYEGSVGLVNLLTATRLVRKGFKVSLVLYGPGVLMASGTRGYPTVGAEAFPGHMAINNQIKTLLKEGATIYACRFAMGALYGFREDDLIEGVTPFNPLDVLDSRADRVAQQGLPAQHLDGLASERTRTMSERDEAIRALARWERSGSTRSSPSGRSSTRPPSAWCARSPTTWSACPILDALVTSYLASTPAADLAAAGIERDRPAPRARARLAARCRVPGAVRELVQRAAHEGSESAIDRAAPRGEPTVVLDQRRATS